MTEDNKVVFYCAQGLSFRLDVAGAKNIILLYVVECLKALLQCTQVAIKNISVIINHRFSGIK